MRKLLVLFSLLSAYAYGQGCPGYAHTYSVTIPSTSVGATLPQFTVMVQGTYPYLAGTGSGGFSTNASGYDIVFCQGGSRLTWSMSRYVPATGEIRANVLLPSVSNGTPTVFQIGVGNGSAVTFLGGTNPYDASTKMALNFRNAALTADDTGLQTGTNNGALYSSNGPAHMGDAATFNGATYISYGATPGFQAADLPRTVTIWGNPTTASESTTPFGYGTNGANNCFALTLSSSFTAWYDCPAQGNHSNTAWTLGSWHRYDLSWGGYNTPAQYYRDGLPDGASQSTTAPSTVLGSSGVGWFPPGNGFVGALTGVKFANTSRSAAWIAAEYLNQTNPDPGFYTISGPPIGPVIMTGPTFVPNSPSSVAASWTTDIASDSEIRCSTVPGGPYNYLSDVIDPVDIVTPATFWGVTSHAMASGGVPNGPVYCVVLSKGKTGVAVISSEVATATLSPVISRPMTISSIGAFTRWSDEHSGVNGAPYIPGQYTGSDHGYFTWADDDNTYASNLNNGIGGTLPGLAYGFVKGDKYRSFFTNLATAWDGGVNNMSRNSYHVQWDGGAVISVKGAMYTWYFDFPNYRERFLAKTTDHFQSTLASTHNVGPTTTNITNMTCSSGSVTATSLLNLTDSFAIIPPNNMAMLVAGATGTNVNGVFGPVTAVTANTVAWTQTALAGSCATWSWTSGGTLNSYGWDVPGTGMSSGSPAGTIPGIFVQCDGKDYACTKAAGMDAYVYFWNWNYLCRIRVENLPTQLDTKWGCYTGKQLGDDGLYSFNWDYTASRMAHATALNPMQFALSPNGRGATFIQELYIPTFNRFILAYEIASPMDSWGGGELIYDAGQYPWSNITPIGQDQRNVDVYVGATPQFPEFDARTMIQLDADTVSISLANDGANWINANPAVSFLSFYTNRDVIITPRGATMAPPALQVLGKEVVNGLDLAYDFDVLTGSLSMPNKAPADARQAWAWSAPNNVTPLWIDRYGSFNFSSINNSNPEFTPTNMFFSNVMLTTPYAQALSASTELYCFGHYPTTMMYSPLANAIALQKSGDLLIAWAGGSNWAVTFKGTLLGNVPITDGTIGCLVIRRDSQNRVTVYSSGAIGTNLPLTPVLGPTVVAGAWSTTPLVMGDAANSFWGIASLLRVWNRDLGDDELIGEMNAVRAKLRARGPGSNIP